MCGSVSSIAPGLSSILPTCRVKTFWFVICVAAVSGACRDRERPEEHAGRAAVAAAGTSATAAQILAAVQAQSGSPLLPAVAQSFKTVTGGLQAQFPAAALAAAKKPAAVVLSAAASGVSSVKDATSGVDLGIALAASLSVPAQTLSGYVIYPAALATGAALLQRTVPEGTEDYIYFPTRPPAAEVEYTLTLGNGVAGLRLLHNQLEMLDSGGAPRLRVTPPYVVGAGGTRIAATLAVEGCPFDSKPGAPWGRPVTKPQSSHCTVRVSWKDDTLAYPAILDPRWTTTGSMVIARQGHTATLLSTGNVLIVGGTTDGATMLSSAELYNPATGTWAITDSMPPDMARTLHTATQLRATSQPTTSGKVLIAGGWDGSTTLYNCQVYDPVVGTWDQTTSMTGLGRHAHTATLLADGKVLLTGGMRATTNLNTAETFDPDLLGWGATNNKMVSALKSHQAVLLNTTNSQLSNKVLVIGGNNGTSTTSTVTLYDPTTGKFTTQTALSSPREGHTATVLPNGRILVTGGKNGSTTLNTTLLFNPSSGSGTWSSAGTMTTARQAHTATLLSTSIVTSGTVLVAGGNNGSGPLSSAELWDGTTTWTATTALPYTVQGQTATPIGNGSVLIAGGIRGSTTLSSATTYDGSFGLGCTSNSQCVTGFCVSGVCCDTACTGTCGACNLPGKVGTCSPVATGTICRTSAGTCDIPETCNGTSTACPADSVVSTGTLCRASADACDVAETCTGTSAACPVDGFVHAGTICRPSVGACDVAESCSGTGAACPADSYVAAGTVCRSSAGACDVAEACSGNSGTCPNDVLQPSTTVCRASAGPCDTLENCSGSSAACPADGFQPVGTVCRASAGACDVAETCSGQAANCPAEAFASATTVCRAATGPCDAVETCTGSSIACPSDSLATNGTTCTDGNQCVTGKTCLLGACTGGQATACAGSGSSATASVSSSGGSVTLETTAVTFAPGAFTDATGVTVTSTTTPAPHGVSAYSPIYKFTPDGARFTQPVTVTFVVGLGLTNPTIMWSRPTGGWDDLGGSYANGRISATVTHFSEGYVAQSPCAGKGEGADCTVGDACSRYTCHGGQCTHGADITCSAPDKCHTAACDPAIGCTAAVAPNGTLCDSANPANVCQAGQCGPVHIQNLAIDALGTLGGSSSSALAVNSTGQVVGTSATSDGASHAFIWAPPGPVADLGLPPGGTATTISTSGLVSGNVRQADGSSHVFFLGSGHIFTDLGPGEDNPPVPVVDPFSGWSFQGAYGAGANDSGEIAGYMTSGGQIRGFLYTPTFGFTDIGALWHGWTWATAIAGDGTVVGSSQIEGTPTDTYASFGHAVIYRDRLLTDMNAYVDPSAGMTLIRANAISDKYIAGTAQGRGPVLPFRFNRTTNEVEFAPTTWTGDVFTSGVNNAGEVVGFGTVDVQGGQVAPFIYSDQLGFRNLNDLIPSNSGWSLQTAAGINDSGDIVGWGWYAGAQRAYRLRLSPEIIACQGQTTNPAPVCIWVDGVTQTDGQSIAIFGYRNTSATSVQPTINEERLNGQRVANPSPRPPAQLVSGEHPGAFLPQFGPGTTLSWTVDGQSVSVSADFARQLPSTPLAGNGAAVAVEDTQVVVRPSVNSTGLVPRLDGIVTAGGHYLAIFGYDNNGPTNIHLPYSQGDNALLVNGSLIEHPSRMPPTWFSVGSHPGAFIVDFSTPVAITWTLAGQSVTASAQLQPIPTTTTPLGEGVCVNGQFVGGVCVNGQFVVTTPNPNAPFAGTISPAQQTNWGLPMPATFAVAADGAATARVPIWVPPGRAGLQPALALSYNSHSSTAFHGLGPGWAVEGLSEITRCPKTLARDGVLSDVTFYQGNGTDSWCLDGQRLIFQSGGTSQGGSWDNATWRTETDRFAKIVSHQADGTDGRGPDSFDVYLKDGRILHYGGGDATVEGPLTLDVMSAPPANPPPGFNPGLPRTQATGLNARYSWALASSADRSGNIIHYSYATTINNNRDPLLSSGDEPCVEQHIDSITYGSQIARFIYSEVDMPEAKRWQHRLFVSGLCLENRRELTRIDLIGPRPDLGRAIGVLKRYALTVRPEGLTSVSETDTNGFSKSVSFKYENASPIPVVPRFNAYPVAIASVLPLTAPTFPGPYVTKGDLNGDGCEDLVYADTGYTIYGQLSNCGSSSMPPFAPPVALAQGGSGPVAIQVVDADRDGRDDIFYSRQYLKNEGVDTNGNPILVDLGETTYLHSAGYDSTTNQFTFEALFRRTFGAPKPPIAGDINGDGLIDLTALNNGAGMQWETYLMSKPLFSTAGATISTGFGGQVASALSPVAVAGRFASRLATSFLTGSDAGQQILYVARADGGQISAPAQANAAVPYTTKYVSLDLNGDGLSDLVSIDPRFGKVMSTDHTRTTPTSFINTGNGFRGRDLGRLPTAFPTEALVSNTANLGAVDIDKDGRDDLVILSQDPRHVVPPSGPVPGWFYPSDGNSLTTPAALSDIVGTGDQPFLILDYDGDGRPDLMTLAPDGAGNYSLKIYENRQPRQLLVGMYGGLNDTPGTIVYDSVGRVARSAPGNDGCPGTVLYPMYCPSGGPLVVTQAYFNNRDQELGEDGVLETYSYNVPMMDALGRGWLGVQNRRVVRTPISDPAQILTVEDTKYGYAIELLRGSPSQYYYPLATRPISDITYFVNHGGALENTATAFSVATGYHAMNPNGVVDAWIPAVFTTKKRTVANFDQVLATIQPAFDAGQWPTEGATDIVSSRSMAILFDAVGNPTYQTVVTNLSDGTQVTGTTTTTYQSDMNLWLVSQPTSRTATETTPQGSATRKWAWTPDPQTGLLVHSTYQSGAPDEQLDTSYVRNGYGLPTSITASIPSGESRTTTIAYDDFDGTFPSRVTNSLGQVTKMVYHPGYGALIAMQDANGQKASWTYDEFGRLTSEKGPDGTGARVYYENPELTAGDASLGGSHVYQVHAVADTGAEVKSVFDTLNRPTVRWTKNYTGVVFDGVTIAYDSHDTRRANRVTVPAVNPFDPATPASTYTYDNMGRPITVTNPDGSGYSYTYGTGASWTVTGPNGQSGARTEDGRGLVLAKSDLVQKPSEPTGHFVNQSFTYGPFGQLRSVTVGSGPTTTISSDASGRKTEIDDPDRGRTTYKWNGFGDQIQEIDADGHATVYVPDPLGRIQQVITVDGIAGYQWDTAENGIGQLAGTTSPDDVSCGYTYDPAGRPTAQTWTLNTGGPGAAGTYSVGLGYDPFGRVSSLTYPAVGGQAALVLNNTYFPNGRLSGIVRGGTSQAIWTANAHNERGQISRETVGNDVVTAHEFLPTTGMLHEVSSTTSSGQVLRDIVYEYDESHRMRQRTTDGQVEIFQHDTLDRLVDWQTGAAPGSPHVGYTFDDLGSLTLAQPQGLSSDMPVSFTPGDGITFSAHKIASSSLGSYSYDARGDQFGSPGRTVTYTNFGLPKSVASGAGVTSFAYDGSRSRVLKVAPGATTVTIGGLFERRVTNTQVTDVFYLPAEGKYAGQIAWSEGGGSVVEEIQYFHDDALGSIEAVTGPDGQTVARQRFEPFGARLSPPVAGVRVGYQGAEHDDDLGLINMNGRIYDPAQFRFMTADPRVTDVFSSQDMHRYAFVRNSPLNYADPSGFGPECTSTTCGPPMPGPPPPPIPPDPPPAPPAPPTPPPAPPVSTDPTPSPPDSSDPPGGRPPRDGNPAPPEEVGTAPPINGTTGFLQYGAPGLTGGSSQGGNSPRVADSSQTNASVPFNNPFDPNRQVCTDTGCSPAGFTVPVFGVGGMGNPGGGLWTRFMAWARGTPAAAPAAAAAAAGAGALGQLATSPAGVRVVQNSAAILSQLFGRGGVGAQSVLAEIQFFGGQLIPPPGLTQQILLQYRAVAMNAVIAGKDALGVQAMRLQIIESALNLPFLK